MRADRIYMLVFWAALMSLWSMSVWGGWAERTYERVGDRSPMWFWLNALGVPRTRDNCVAFIKQLSILGMALSTAMLLVTLVLAK